MSSTTSPCRQGIDAARRFGIATAALLRTARAAGEPARAPRRRVASIAAFLGLVALPRRALDPGAAGVGARAPRADRAAARGGGRHGVRRRCTPARCRRSSSASATRRVRRRSPGPGTWLVFFPMVVIWVCDSAAMSGGRAIGGAKLAPTISPGKTRSGSTVGVLGGAAGGADLRVPGLPARRHRARASWRCSSSPR